MMVAVYVDWESREILTKEQFEEEVKGFVANIKDDKRECDERLFNFIDTKRLDTVDLFHMSETDKEALRKEFEEWLVEDAKTQLIEETFDEVELNL